MKVRFALVAIALTLGVLSLVGVSYIASEQITVGATAVGFTALKITPAGQPQAQTAVCRLETAEVRYTIDGTTVTASVGTLLEVGDILTVQGHDVMARFQAIRTGSSGQLDCNYSAP